MLIPTIDDVLPLVPACLAGTVFLVLVAVSKWRKTPFALDTAGALAFAVAMVWGYRRISAWPTFPPIQSTERVIWTIAFAAAMGIVESPFWKKPSIAPLLRIPAICLLLVWLFETPAKSWSLVESVKWYAAGGASIFVTWYAIKEVAAKHSGLTLFSLSTVIGVFGLVAGSYHGAVLGQLSGILSMMCGFALPFVFFVPRAAIGRGAVAVIVIAWAGLLLNAKIYLYEPPPAKVFILFALAPLGVTVAVIPALRARFPRAAGPLGVLAVLIITAAAFWTAKGALPPPSEDPLAAMYGSGK